MTNKIPIKLSGMNVFKEGSNNSFAVVDLTLPSLTLMTDSVSGAGILGTVDVPAEGHFESMELGITWRTIDKDMFSLMGSSAGLEVRGAFSGWDNAKTATVYTPIKVVVRGMSKGVDLGTLAQNATTDSTNNIEVIYIKIFLDGQAALEFDRFNYIYRLNGQDMLADVRKALGLA
ncbi:phage major tail tube protein [Paenibacillus sp. Marseille-Q4541]|uniref:phage major tail tube protein n=1 Tax=Paenibacillus sp. Marseille-Q4541 TaxID=2831522 RepID=UPI001BAE241B|nr:phage major tail tube protein [Paenibacillus sp. Marseille-Q4541]